MIINILKDHIFINKQIWINSKYLKTNYNFIGAHLNVAKSGTQLNEIINNLILSKKANEEKNIAYFGIVKKICSLH